MTDPTPMPNAMSPQRARQLRNLYANPDGMTETHALELATGYLEVTAELIRLEAAWHAYHETYARLSEYAATHPNI